jgi:hypothetical protein
MRYLLTLLLISMPAHADFSFYAGVSKIDESKAKPEVDLQNPLGILRMEYETESETTIFCEHISSIPKDERGSGVNHCGFLIKL